MNMKRNYLFMLALSIGLMLFVVACSNGGGAESSESQEGAEATEGSGEEGSGEPVELEFWTMQLKPTFTEYIEGVISDYEAENPNVTIKWVDVPWADMEKKILSAVASNTAPDVANLNTQFASQLAELDALVNMDEAVPADVKDKYFEGVWNSNSFNGKTFGIPWYLSSQVLMYNKNLLEQAGISEEEVPKTFSEVQEVASDIKQETDKYSFFPPIDGSHLLEMMVMMGADLTNEDMTKAAFNTEKGAKAFEFFVDMYNNGYIPPAALTEGHGKAIELYQAGELAMFSSGPQFLDQIEENAPDVYENTGIGTFITGETGLKNVSAMNLTVPEQSEHQKEAVDFSLFMTNAENQVEFDKITTILPSIETALEDPYFNELPENPTPQEKARIVSAEQLKDSEVLVPPMKNYSELQKSMYDALQSATLGKQSIEEALNQAEQEWNEILNK